MHMHQKGMQMHEAPGTGPGRVDTASRRRGARLLRFMMRRIGCGPPTDPALNEGRSVNPGDTFGVRGRSTRLMFAWASSRE